VPESLYDAVGGMPFFERLVERFYAGVASDDVLLATYPDPDDLTDARRKLTLFLAQYWGGPSTYHEERGHPALRMRHAPFAIGEDVADRWLRHMRAAVDELDPAEPYKGELLEYLSMAAPALRNR
jgi:hemoglobin